MEEAAAERHRQLAGHVEELERQLEGATHDLDEWQGQAADANEHAQQLQHQLQEINSRAERAQVSSPGWLSLCFPGGICDGACTCQSASQE